MTPARLGLFIAAAVAALDQASKLWIVESFGLEARGPVTLLPFLDLMLARNKGISYSFFRADSFAGKAALIAIALIAIIVLGVWIARTPSRFTATALGLVAGGAAGNVVDRIQTGAVIDFLHFHTPVSLGPLSNYVFNLADAAITIGVALLLYESVTAGRDAPKTVPRDDSRP